MTKLLSMLDCWEALHLEELRGPYLRACSLEACSQGTAKVCNTVNPEPRVASEETEKNGV